jgi:hypothetical protein
VVTAAAPGQGRRPPGAAAAVCRSSRSAASAAGRAAPAPWGPCSWRAARVPTRAVQPDPPERRAAARRRRRRPPGSPDRGGDDRSQPHGRVAFQRQLDLSRADVVAAGPEDLRRAPDQPQLPVSAQLAAHGGDCAADPHRLAEVHRPGEADPVEAVVVRVRGGRVQERPGQVRVRHQGQQQEAVDEIVGGMGGSDLPSASGVRYVENAKPWRCSRSIVSQPETSVSPSSSATRSNGSGVGELTMRRQVTDRRARRRAIRCSRRRSGGTRPRCRRRRPGGRRPGSARPFSGP